MPPTVSAATVLADRVGDVDLAFLLADVWERPQHHLDLFARDEVPSVEALELEEIRNLDRLAREVVAEANGSVQILSSSDRQKLAEPLVKRQGLSGPMANVQLLLDEFDAFLAGRGITELDAYLRLRRRGGGSGLARADRERVFAAYAEYRAILGKRGVRDWPAIRSEALRLAQQGAGPRFDGVIIDEAQDLSAVGMRLLLAWTPAITTATS